MIVALAGRKRSGKDSLGRALVGQLGFTRVGLADALKDLAGELLQVPTADWEILKTSPTIYNVVRNEAMTGRDILQRLGVGVRKVLGPDTWIKAALDRCGVVEINDVPGHHGWRQSGNFVVTDVRFPNELHAFQAAGGIAIRLNREDSLESWHHFEPGDPLNEGCTFGEGSNGLCMLKRESHPTILPTDRHESETSLPDDSNDTIIYDNVFTGSLEMNTGRAFAYVKGLL